MKPHVLHVLAGGSERAERALLDLALGMDPDQFRASVVLPTKVSRLCEQLHQSGIATHLLPIRGTSFSVAQVGALVRLIKGLKVDLIHSHQFGANVYCSLAGMLTGTPVISSFHGSEDARPRNRRTRTALRMINRGSRFMVFASEHLEAHYTRFGVLDPERIAAIYNALGAEGGPRGDEGGARQAMGLSASDFVVGALGSIRAPNRYHILIESAARVCQQHQGVKFVVAGNGRGTPLLAELEALIRRLDLADSFHFVGHRENPAAFIGALDLFVVGSAGKGLSIATLEAMAAGVPVVATGGPDQLISHGVTGLVVDPFNADTLAEAITDLVQSPPLRQTLGEQGREFAQARYSKESMLNGYTTLYQRVLDASLAPST